MVTIGVGWGGAGARAFAAIVVEVTAAREGGRRGWREEAKREVKAGVKYRNHSDGARLNTDSD